MGRQMEVERPTEEQAAAMEELSATVARECGELLRHLEDLGYDAHQQGCAELRLRMLTLSEYATEHHNKMTRARERALRQ